MYTCRSKYLRTIKKGKRTGKKVQMTEGTTNTICVNDVLSGPASYIARTTDYTYGSVSVATGLDYQSAKIDCSNSTTTALFAELLMEKVFKITNDGAYTNFASYTPSSKTESGTTTYVQIPNIAESGTPVYTHLAGTIFSFKCNYGGSTAKGSTISSFNVAIFLEEVYKEDGNLLNKVNIEFREEEPLMQTIISTNGTVYDFKKGVKLSEFGKFIEQSTTKPPNGYVKYHSMPPTNMSIGVSNEPVTTTDQLVPVNENVRYTTTTGGDEPSTKGTTYFTGYIVIGGFNDENVSSKTDVDGLIGCKPYLTIIHVDKLAELKTTFASITDSTGLMFTKLDNLNIKTAKENIPSSSVFETVFTDEFTSGATLNDSDANFYVLSSLKTT